MLAAVYRDDPEKQVVPCREEVQDNAARDKIMALLPLLCCPECGAPLQAALGKINVWHFQHAQGTATDCELRNGESEEHVTLKVSLHRAAKGWFPRAKLRLEAKLPEADGRKADLLVTLPNGERMAFEAQRSSLTFVEFEQRTKDYLNAGIGIVWVFNAEEFKQDHRRVPFFAGWLLDQGLLVMGAKIIKMGEKTQAN